MATIRAPTWTHYRKLPQLGFVYIPCVSFYQTCIQVSRVPSPSSISRKMVYNATLPNRIVVLLIDLASALPREKARDKDVPYLQNAAVRFANLVSCSVERFLAQFNSCNECNLLWSYRFFDSAARVTSSFCEERSILQPVRLANVEKFRRTIAKRVRSLDPCNRSTTVPYGAAIAKVLEDALSDVDWKQYNAASSIDSFMDNDDGSSHVQNFSCRGGHSLMPSLFLFGRVPETVDALHDFVGLSSRREEDFMSPRRRAARSLLQLRGEEWDDDGLSQVECQDKTHDETVDNLRQALMKMENFQSQLQQIVKRNITFVWVSSRPHRYERRPSSQGKLRSIFHDWFLSYAKSFHIKDLYSLLLDRRVLPVRSQSHELEKTRPSSRSSIHPTIEEENQSCRRWSTVQVTFPQPRQQERSGGKDALQLAHYFFAQMSFSESSGFSDTDSAPQQPTPQHRVLALRGFVPNNLRDDELLSLGSFRGAAEFLRPIRFSKSVSESECDASARYFAGLLVDLARSRQCMVAEIMPSLDSENSRTVLICALTPSCAVIRDFSGCEEKLASISLNSYNIDSTQSPCSTRDGALEMVSSKFFENFLPGIWPPRSDLAGFENDNALTRALTAYAGVCDSDKISIALDGYNSFRDCERFSSTADAVQSQITPNTKTATKKRSEKLDRGLMLLKQLESQVRKIPSRRSYAVDPEDPELSTVREAEHECKLGCRSHEALEPGESIVNKASRAKPAAIAIKDPHTRAAEDFHEDASNVPGLKPSDHLLSLRNETLPPSRMVTEERQDAFRISDKFHSKIKSFHDSSPSVQPHRTHRRRESTRKSDPVGFESVHPFLVDDTSPEKIVETCTTATNARYPGPKPCGSPSRSVLHENAATDYKQIVTNASEAFKLDADKLANSQNTNLTTLVHKCMSDLSNLAHELAKLSQPSVLTAVTKACIRREEEVSAAFQNARRKVQSSSAEPQAMQPALWKAALDAYEQVVWRISKAGSAVLELVDEKRRVKYIRRCQKQCNTMLSCVQVSGETTPITIQSLNLYHESFSQFFSEVLSHFIQGSKSNVFKDILESIFEGFEQKFAPSNHGTSGQRNVTSQSAVKCDHGTGTSTSNLAQPDPYLIPADDNVSSRSLKRQSSQYGPSKRASVSKRPKLARKDPKQVVAQARHKNRRVDAAGTHRTQFSRHVGDISRAKESQKPLAFAKERHSRSGYSTANRQKSTRRISDGSDQEPLALPSRAEAGRTLRPPVKRALLGEIKNCARDTTYEDFDTAIPDVSSLECGETNEMFSLPGAERFTLL